MSQRRADHCRVYRNEDLGYLGIFYPSRNLGYGLGRAYRSSIGYACGEIKKDHKIKKASRVKCILKPSFILKIIILYIYLTNYNKYGKIVLRVSVERVTALWVKHRRRKMKR